MLLLLLVIVFLLKLKTHVNIALGYFLIIALLGALLRLFFVIDIPLNYKNIVHAHSHIALLGWIYTSLTTLIYFCYLKNRNVSKKYKVLFWSTQFTLIGMLIAFPITGYAFYSILFSSLFLIASYWFFWFVNKYISNEQKKKKSYKLIRAGLWFMVISSIGPWALGAIMNTLGNSSIWYKNAIYFYLHFQYNGWFIVTLFGLCFYILEKLEISISNSLFNRFFWLLISSVILTLFISVLWTKPATIFYILSGLGALFQFFAFAIFTKLIIHNRFKLESSIPRFTLNIFKIAGFLFVLKMVMQLLGVTPYFSNIIANHVEFPIGYLHWTFLGVVSITLFGMLMRFNLIKLPKYSFRLFFIGFLLTEILIFYKGIMHWLNLEIFQKYYTLLAIVSIILLVAIAAIFSIQIIGLIKKTRRN